MGLLIAVRWGYRVTSRHLIGSELFYVVLEKAHGATVKEQTLNWRENFCYYDCIRQMVEWCERRPTSRIWRPKPAVVQHVCSTVL